MLSSIFHAKRTSKTSIALIISRILFLHLSESVMILYNSCKISLQQNILASYVTQKYLSLSFFKFFREKTTKKVKKVWVLIFY